MSINFATIFDDQEDNIGHYELLKTIGEGNFAKVKLGRHILTGCRVAIKIISQESSSGLTKFVLREVSSMQALRHPNIVQLFEVINTPQARFLVMEYLCGGDLWTYIHTHGRLSEVEARGIFRQLVSAVDFCHGKGIVHRDLKPQNVLFDMDRRVKIADFGFSTPFSSSKLSTFCGSPSHAAPELFLRQPYDGPAVDIWSLGVLLYRMVTATLPFYGMDLKELEAKVVKGKYAVPSHVSLELRNLLRKLITLNPEQRSSLRNIMPDPWLNTDEAALTPYAEPPEDNINPWVAQEMERLGFQGYQIQDALSKKTFNDVMATYLILNAQKPKVHHRVIRVKPFQAPSATSGVPTAAPDNQQEGSGLAQGGQLPRAHQGQGAESSAGSPASRKSGAAPSSPIPEPATSAPGPSPGSRTSAPGPSPGSRTSAPGPSILKTSAPGPSRESRPSILRTRIPGPSHESRPSILRTSNPGPSHESRPSILRTSNPGPSHESRPSILRTSNPGPSAPGPSSDSRTSIVRPSTLGPSCDSRMSIPGPSTPRPSCESRISIVRPSTPGPSHESRPSTPGPSTPGPSRESRPSTPGPSTPRSSRESGPSTPRSSRESGPSTPRSSRESRPRTAKPIPKSTTDSPKPIPESTTDSPKPIPKSTTDSPKPIPDSRTDSPNPILESRSSISLPSMEFKTSTSSPAPQCGPGDSSSSHSTRTSSGTPPQGIRKGRPGMARRCWNFCLKQFCLRPSKTAHGKHRKVAPL